MGTLADNVPGLTPDIGGITYGRELFLIQGTAGAESIVGGAWSTNI